MVEIKNKELILQPDEIIMNKIYVIRGLKVMIDRDLAELYGVETKRLKEAVRRNINRFPEDFMFELDTEELEIWRTQIASSKSDRMGLRHPPFLFYRTGNYNALLCSQQRKSYRCEYTGDPDLF